jgi:hypothetical protein
MSEAPPGIDVTRPSIARVYDYLLGGKDHFAADRELAATLLKITPGLKQIPPDNRAFLCAAAARAAREGGIGQFLDLGAGLPVSPAIHEAAREVIGGARFTYVDIDPSAALHGRALLGHSDGLVSVQADLTDTDAVLSNPLVRANLDLDQPVGIIIGAVAHFFSAPRMREITGRYLARVKPGSWLMITTARAENDEIEDELAPAYTAADTFRHSHKDFASFFDGTAIVPPGLVEAHRWIVGQSTPPPAEGLYVLSGAGIKL